MHTHNGSLYPVLGVGASMTMLWVGVVVGCELWASDAPRGSAWGS